MPDGSPARWYSRSEARSSRLAGLALTGCSEVSNNPHPLGSEKTNTIFAPILSRSPKYLDPTSSYSNDETPFTYQIYEPLYGYHYLKRPTSSSGAPPRRSRIPLYLDKDGKVLAATRPARTSRKRSSSSSASRASSSRRIRRSPRTRRANTSITT
jgi:hypothetical protein